MKFTGEHVKELLRIDHSFGEVFAAGMNDAQEAAELLKAAGFNQPKLSDRVKACLVCLRHETYQEKTRALGRYSQTFR